MYQQPRHFGNGGYQQNFQPRFPRYGPPPRGPYQFQQQANTDFWCETCDRGFNSQYFLDNHKKQHEKCNIDGCQFVAHPKVITRHIQMQHSTGLYQKICKLRNPEEINKWREERKKKYPTKINIEKKEAEIKEKIERGEKMGIQNRYNKNQSNIGTKRSHNDTHNNRRNNMSTNKFKNRNKKVKLPNLVTFSVQTNGLKPFTGIQHLINDSNDAIEVEEQNNFNIIDDDWLDNDIKEESDKKVCNALSALIGNYESDEGDITERNVPKTLKINNCKTQGTTTNATNTLKDQANSNNCKSKVISNPKDECHIINKLVNQDKDNSTEFKEISKPKNPNNITNKLLNPEQIKNPKVISNDPNTSNNKFKEGTINMSDDDGPPEEQIILKNDNDMEVTEDSKPIKPAYVPKQKIPNTRPQPSQQRRKIPSTLLQKLLSKEIKHERNIVLQCVHHVVKNQFFVNKK